MASNKAADVLPSDALVIKSVLQSMGVQDYDSRVVHQLLDFMYRNVADVLQVAEAFSDRAGSQKHEIGLDDVMLAIQAKAATSFVTPPSQETLQAMAERRNSTALPSTTTAKYGFRLPPAEDCLIAPNVQFHPPDPLQDMDWEDEPIATGMGTEPFKPPHAKMSSHVPGPDLRARHPAFQDPDQGSKPKQAAKLAAEPASIASDQQPVDMEAG